MMAKFLRRNGCTVTTACNGKLGLKCLREDQFDVCFMDFYMVNYKYILLSHFCCSFPFSCPHFLIFTVLLCFYSYLCFHIHTLFFFLFTSFGSISSFSFTLSYLSVPDTQNNILFVFSTNLNGRRQFYHQYRISENIRLQKHRY